MENVIILDKSGSMQSIRRVAVDSVNEIIASIRKAQKENELQDNYFTLVAFCGCELKTIYDCCAIDDVKEMKMEDYEPCCMTPLYDAVGNTITRIHKQVADSENTIVNVNIITDGYENASHEFTHKAIKSLIEAYKSEGWLFAYIGADHDVEKVAFDLAIDNTLEFDKSEQGVLKAMRKLSRSRNAFIDSMAPMVSSSEISSGVKRSILRQRSGNFFKND